MGRINSRSKGARAERALAKKFSEWWGSDFTRTPSSGGFRTKAFRDDWNAAGDLVTPDESFPFCVESKHAEGWHLEKLITAPENAIVKWWRQTVGETPDGKVPLLVFKKNHHPHLFMMPLDTWQSVDKMNVGPLPIFTIEGVEVVIGLLADLFTTDPEDWKDD